MTRFEMMSSSFDEGEWIPKDNSKEGLDRAPALEWRGAPEKTEEFVLVCEDPDAPQANPWVHWLLYNISGQVTKLPEGIPTKEKVALPPNALQGLNSFGTIGYGGPLPPTGAGPHRYYFRLFALDAKLSLAPRANKAELFQAMEGHVIATAVLMGKYERKMQLRRAG